MVQIKKQLKRLIGFIYHSLINKIHALRDVVIVSIALVIIGGLMAYSSYFSSQKKDNGQLEMQVPVSVEQLAVQTEEKKVAAIVSSIDTAAWTSYQNTWYGLILKYPQEWKNPIIKNSPFGANWEKQIQFRMKQTSEDNPFEGFDVVIYSIAKIKEVTKTDEYPQLKNAELIVDFACATLGNHLLETGDYPAEEIYIPADDACYNATLFISNTRGDYIYNLVPRLKEGAGLAGDPSDEIATHLPEFLAIASTLNFIDIIRPKPVPPKPKIIAPFPVSYKKVGGRLVCEKSDDEPSKSNKNKSKHLDMECCLDPDEYPNPHCYYPKDKYGKYL